ncbi:folate family ECF transporter S component [Levilactobacillus zymae]|uniref:folate family ECF transporter S component n=1 Tax=Levilactobacillus zymae TaxID=267363 RepID=UPI0028B8CD4E|nr:folate family ECF transporter S component [Levilactobacillus zymae]MDT6980683.1 folate family ECF transporter S component [Levilactobacillus zymae]
MKTMVRTQLPKLDTLSMVTMGLLMAVQLVVSRFTISNQFMRLSFTFLVAALLAKWFGPWWGMMTAALVDIVGTLMTGGPYFVGFTISAIVGSLIYALFFYRQPITWWRIIVAQLLVVVLVNIGLNSEWLVIMYHTPLWGILPVRLMKEAVTTPIQIVLLYVVLKSHVIQNLEHRLKTKA